MGFKIRGMQSEAKWIVQVPKGGNFYIHYVTDLTLWQRLMMRCIGWGVAKGAEQHEGE